MACFLVRIFASRLDDGRPAVDLAYQRAPGGLGGGALLRHRIGINVVEALHQIRVRECGLQRAGEPLHDRRRRALRGEHAMPDTDLETLQPGLIGGRQIGERFEPRLGGDRISLDLLAGNRPRRVGGLIAADVDLLADQVVHHPVRCRDTARW